MKKFIIDFINFDIIAIFFLFQSYSQTKFILLIIMLIFDLIHLYLIERKNAIDTYDFEDEYRYDHLEG